MPKKNKNKKIIIRQSAKQFTIKEINKFKKINEKHLLTQDEEKLFLNKNLRKKYFKTKLLQVKNVFLFC